MKKAVGILLTLVMCVMMSVPAQAASRPEVAWTYPVSLTALQSPYTILVNEDNLLEKTYKPKPLVKVKNVKRATSATVEMEKTAAEALKSMFDAALEVREYTYTTTDKNGAEVSKTVKYENGMVLYLKSGYRSYGTQATTYANYLDRNNGVDDGYVAKPGSSEHQSGLCCDILNKEYAGRDRMTQDFKNEVEAHWMKENCAEFGFILRYTEEKEATTGIKFEPWHFRYVGQEVACYIMGREMSLEEFTVESQRALSDFLAAGGNIDEQLQFEKQESRLPPESNILEECGEDGDHEVTLTF